MIKPMINLNNTIKYIMSADDNMLALLFCQFSIKMLIPI